MGIKKRQIRRGKCKEYDRVFPGGQREAVRENMKLLNRCLIGLNKIIELEKWRPVVRITHHWL